MKIAKQIVDRILAHARDAYPNESCGILAGRDSVPTHIYQVKNTDPNPSTRYFMDEKELIWVFKNMRPNGLELVAIYHSHPETQAYPSPTDVKLAYYPEAYYILTSLQDPQNPIIRAYRIQDGKIAEEQLETV
jgi:proteasome lid subunit RPN8/RPN11